MDLPKELTDKKDQFLQEDVARPAQRILAVREIFNKLEQLSVDLPQPELADCLTYDRTKEEMLLTKIGEQEERIQELRQGARARLFNELKVVFTSDFKYDS